MKFSQASMRPPGESAFHVIVLRVSGCSSLRHCSRAPAASTASGGKALVSTPVEIGSAATRLETAPQNHHVPQNGYDITRVLKARPLAIGPRMYLMRLAGL